MAYKLIYVHVSIKYFCHIGLTPLIHFVLWLYAAIRFQNTKGGCGTFADGSRTGSVICLSPLR